MPRALEVDPKTEIKVLLALTAHDACQMENRHSWSVDETEKNSRVLLGPKAVLLRPMRSDGKSQEILGGSVFSLKVNLLFR